jgi:hypothetical protein
LIFKFFSLQKFSRLFEKFRLRYQKLISFFCLPKSSRSCNKLHHFIRFSVFYDFFCLQKNSTKAIIINFFKKNLYFEFFFIQKFSRTHKFSVLDKKRRLDLLSEKTSRKHTIPLVFHKKIAFLFFLCLEKFPIQAAFGKSTFESTIKYSCL